MFPSLPLESPPLQAYACVYSAFLPGDVPAGSSTAFVTIQTAAGNFPTCPSTCPIDPLVTANAASVFRTFQLLSVTDEQRVRIM